MRKYYYGKYDTDTYPAELKNDFHFLCYYFGLYLKYCDNSEGCMNFDEYIRLRGIDKKSDEKFQWTPINKAQAYIRDQLNKDANKHISKRQIRKLGFSGHLSIPMFPKTGLIIENKLFSIIFEIPELSCLKKRFIDYLYLKWENDNEKTGYYMDDSDPEWCVKKTAANFCGFQNDVLEKHYSLKKQLHAHPAYIIIQKEIERRK